MPGAQPFPPTRVAVTGLGGYARHHHLTLQRLENAGLCRVVATCDPSAKALLAQNADLRLGERGVKIFADFVSMLAGIQGAADCVTLPTPIHLHAPMHRACIEAGLPAYVEKPPTLWWEELEAMIATDARAAHPSEVGFNFISEPARQALKTRLVAGEFGRLREAAFVGVWPRPPAYFQRNGWAGRLFQPGGTVPLLDSVVGNAMGHYLQNLLYWAGPRLESFATVLEVRASLYRVHAIEGTDTVFAEARTPEGAVLRVGATHAAAPAQEGHAEYVVCERASWCYVTDRDCLISWNDGRRETVDLRTQGDWQERNFRRYFEYLAGRHARPLVSLGDARPFVTWNDLLYCATPGIITIGHEHVEWRGEPGVPAARGVEDALRAFAAEGRWPHENSRLPWARPPGRAHLSELPWTLARLRALAVP
jgi:predicted dehydrogenase